MDPEGPWFPHPRWKDTINEAISPIDVRTDPLVDYGDSDVNSSSPPHEETRDYASSFVEVRWGACGRIFPNGYFQILASTIISATTFTFKVKA